MQKENKETGERRRWLTWDEYKAMSEGGGEQGGVENKGYWQWVTLEEWKAMKGENRGEREHEGEHGDQWLWMTWEENK